MASFGGGGPTKTNGLMRRGCKNHENSDDEKQYWRSPNRHEDHNFQCTGLSANLFEVIFHSYMYSFCAKAETWTKSTSKLR